MNQSITVREEIALRSSAANGFPISRLPKWTVPVLVVLCLVAWGRTLQCYFLADDFIPLAYMHDGFHGQLSALLARLIQPWQDANVQLLWRPLSEMSMWCDFLLWQANAVGYHITNIFWHSAATIVFFFLSKELTNDAKKSFWAGALFAVTPLHTETVSWMIGRVDSISTTFFLTAFWLFLRSRRWLSCCAFVAALFAKESAVVLPAVLAAYALLMKKRPENTEALKRTLPLWLILLPWFGARQLILGTPVGGYIGSIGDVFAMSSISRFVHCQFDKIFYPFNDFVLSDANPAIVLLHCLYAAAGVLLLWRLRSMQWDAQTKRLISFGLAWLAISVIPVLPVFYLNGALTGSRFLYAATAPMILLFCSMIPPVTVLFGAFVAIFAFICNFNTNAVIESGNEARSFQTEVASAVERLPVGAKLVLFDAPRQDSNEQIFYTAEMMHSALRPPFFKESIADRVQLLSPNTYIPEDPLNMSLLECALKGTNSQMVIWNEGIEKIEPFDFRSYLKECAPNNNLSQPKLKVLPSSFGLRSDSFFVPYADRHLLFEFESPDNAASCVVEISKPNAYFMHYTRTLQDSQLSPYAVRRIALAATRGRFELYRSDFGTPERFQIRLAALDKKGKVIGATSDPLSIDLSSYLLKPPAPP